MTSRIDREKLFEFCRIPVERLADHPDSRIHAIIHDSAKDVYASAAQIMIDELVTNIKNNKPTRWVLPAGPGEQYPIFIDYVNKNKISLESLHIFLMDDYLDWNCRPFPKDNAYFNLESKFNRIFFEKIDPKLNVPMEQRHYPRYNDLDAMDQAIENIGGLDTVFAGLGFRGLVAYCEPPHSPWFIVTEEDYCEMKTRIYPINVETFISNSQRRFGGLTQFIPPLAVSIGFKSLLKTTRVVFICATGQWKRTAIRMLMFHEPTVEYPATLFTDKVKNVTLLTDKNSAEPPLQPL
jgi:glucosamine-6-phosphate deaminase